MSLLTAAQPSLVGYARDQHMSPRVARAVIGSAIGAAALVGAIAARDAITTCWTCGGWLGPVGFAVGSFDVAITCLALAGALAGFGILSHRRRAWFTATGSLTIIVGVYFVIAMLVLTSSGPLRVDLRPETAFEDPALRDVFIAINERMSIAVIALVLLLLPISRIWAGVHFASSERLASGIAIILVVVPITGGYLVAWPHSAPYLKTAASASPFGVCAMSSIPAIDPGTTRTWNGSSWIAAPLPLQCEPGGRPNGAMTYDARDGVVVMYGGHYSSDMWMWNGTTWIAGSGGAIPHIPGDSNPDDATVGPLMYDGALGKVLFVDKTATVWQWDHGPWSELTQPTMPLVTNSSPASSMRILAGFDEGRSELVLVAVASTSQSSTYETWAWAASGWRRLDRETDQSTAPEQDGSSTLTYDASMHELMAVGHHRTWAWDGHSWTQTAQPFDGFGAGAYDPNHGEVVWVQGSAVERTTGKTWILGAAGWKQPATGQIDVMFNYAAVAFDQATNNVVSFG